jgi:hypothetical protein
MPNPKKKAVKKGARTARAKQSQAEQAEVTIEAELEGPVVAVVVAQATVGALFAARDWRGLIGDNVEGRIESLLDHAMSSEGASDSWADVLVKAGIPYLAWSVMRDELDDAKHLYVAWARRKADLYAHETIELSDEAGNFAMAEVVGALKLRADARRWMAARLDPQLYGVKVQTLATIEKRDLIRIEIVDESGPR